MGLGVGRGDNRTIDAVRQAVYSPLLETTIEGATGIIINITGGLNMTMGEIQHAVDLVKEVVDRDAAIIFGADIREDIDDEVQVTIIATGFAVKPTDKPLKQNVFAGKETENSALSPAKELYGSRIEEPVKVQQPQVSAEQLKETAAAYSDGILPNPNMNLKEDSSIPPFLRKLRNKNN